MQLDLFAPPTERDRWVAAAEDLLNSPRHSINEKGRRWLRAKLRALKKQGEAA